MSDKRREAWLLNSNLPKRYRENRWWAEYTWPAGPEKVIQHWLQMFTDGSLYAAGPDMGTGLLLDGEPGAGKTTRVCALLRDIIDSLPAELPSYTPVLWLRYDKLVRLEKSTFGAESDPRDERLLQGILGDSDPKFVVNLLAIDDLGKEYKTNFTERIFENVIRARHDEGLPTVITTNVALNKWAETYGPSVESFAHEAFLHVPMIVDDRRKA